MLGARALAGLLLLSACSEPAVQAPADAAEPADAGVADRPAPGQDATTRPDGSAAADAAPTPLPDAGPPDGGRRPSGQVFFAPEVLHEVEIQVAPEHLDQLENDLQNRVPCRLTYDGRVVDPAGIRKKGQTSLRPLAEKPSFSVKLDELVPGTDLDGIERFALNNTLQDPTFTSEALSYLFAQRAGIPAPRTAHAVVRFNGQTKGIYVVAEATNKEFLRDHFGDGSGNLYEGPWDFTQDVAAADLKDEAEGRTRDDLAALTRAVLDSPPEGLEAALAPLADVEQLLTAVAVDMAFCLWDGYSVAAWNYYLYHVPGAASSPSAGRFVLLPHGADWPYWVADLDPLDPDFRPWGEQFPPGILAVKLTQPPFAQRYRQRLRAVRDQAFDAARCCCRASIASRPRCGWPTAQTRC